jgi:hypothetical protein
MPDQTDYSVTVDNMADLVKTAAVTIQKLVHDRSKFEKAVEVVENMEKVGMAIPFPAGLSLVEKARRLADEKSDSDLDKLAMISRHALPASGLGTLAGIPFSSKSASLTDRFISSRLGEE